MNITPIDNPRLLDRDVRDWKGFSGNSQDEAVEKFTKLYPHYAAQPITCFWCGHNLTLFVPWDWRRE